MGVLSGGAAQGGWGGGGVDAVTVTTVKYSACVIYLLYYHLYFLTPLLLKETVFNTTKCHRLEDDMPQCILVVVGCLPLEQQGIYQTLFLWSSSTDFKNHLFLSTAQATQLYKETIFPVKY